MHNRYDQNKEIHYIATNPCNMAAMNLKIFEENYEHLFAAKKDPTQTVRTAQKVYVIHPCNLVNKDHISTAKLKDADKIIVLGCYREDDFKGLDNVEFWTIKDIQSKASKLTFGDNDFAEVRVNYGCNQNCAFCPIKRDENYDRPIQDIITEVGDATHVKLCSDDLASYSYDLITLLEALPAKTVELTYVYPTYLIANEEYFVKNRRRFRITVPMQSGSDRVLSLMNRGDYKASDILRVVKQLYRPTCHFVYGSPTETFAEFMQTFETEQYFNNPRWFRYQAYEGTKWHKEYGFETSAEIDKMQEHLLKHSKGGVVDWNKNKTINR